MDLPFRTLDVFTDRLFGGNPLGVFPDAAHLPTHLVCTEAEGEGVDVRVRMFAPGSGVPEDPATGSAAAALGGYLARVDGRAEGTLAWRVERGLEIGRPSILEVEADRSGGETVAVRVGGRAVFVSRGAMAVHRPEGG